MFKRIMSAIVFVPIFVFVILKGGILLQVASVMIGYIALYEMFRALKNKYKPIIMPTYLLVAVSIMFLNNKIALFSFMILYTIYIIIYYVINNDLNIADVSVTFFLSFYIIFSVYHIYLLGNLESKYFVFYLFILAWVTDSGAYFVGRSIGKHKLAPVVSPNKTIEGAVGGVIITTITCVLLTYFIDSSKMLTAVLLGIFGSFVSIFGDLFLSKIKREISIKDYGKLIPGHGGILDRFDSVIIIAPLVYYIVKVVG